MLIVILVVFTMAIMFAVLFKHDSKDSPRWYIDNTLLEVDGEYYKEGSYWNIKTVGIVPAITISFTGKEKIEEMVKIFINHYGYCKVYNSHNAEGKIVYDLPHCERYCNSVRVNWET